MEFTTSGDPSIDYVFSGITWTKLIRSKTASYVYTVAFTVVLYDPIITTAYEVSVGKFPCDLRPTAHILKARLVWPGALTVPKLLYYLNRYLTIAVSLYCVSDLFSFPWEGIMSRNIFQENIVKRCTYAMFHPTGRLFYLLNSISCSSLFQYRFILISTHAMV